MILEKFVFSFIFNLRKQNVTVFNIFFFAVPLNYYFQGLQVSSHRIKGDFSDNGCSSVPLVEK